MVVEWLRQVQQVLQQAVHGGGVEEVEPAHHMGDALGRIIHHHRQMIAGGRIRAGQDDIAPGGRIDLDLAFFAIAGFGPGERRADESQRLLHVEPQRMAKPALQQSLAFRRASFPVLRGVERRAIRIARPGFAGRLRRMHTRLHLAAGQEGGIDQPLVFQPAQRRMVVVKMFGLAAHRFFPGKTDPGEIGKDLVLEFRTAARLVDVLDPQEKAPLCVQRHLLIDERGERMPEMQEAVGAWGKAEDGLLTFEMDHGFFCHESGGNSMAVIRDERDIAEGLAALMDLDPALRPVIEAAGPVPLRLSEPGFAGLAHIIVSQMVSKASANAIWSRMVAQGPVTPESFLAHAPDVVAGFGLSRAKALTISGVARAIVDGELDLARLGDMPIDEAMARLVALKGIGPWTAEVYLMFCLGAPDIFPVGDVALRAALGHAFGMNERPSLTLAAERTALWCPWRSVAARLFWAYYAREMRRDALPVT